MRKRHILLYIVATLLGLITINNNVSALSYSSDVNIGFTFNPTISLTISPDNLTIPNLTPGTAAESNTITVNVATNTAYGYNLTANVGSNTANYNTTNLVHATSATSTPTTNATFASLAYGASITNKDNLSPNTWGYSYSNDSGTTWRPYSGLPLYSDTNHSTNLISTYTAADSKSIEFKIAAKANNTQPSGDYTNIINFYATSVPEPPLLYDVVEDMTKGTLAENNVKLSDPITQANSGVYTYDPTVYGTASDASNDYNIYFYRGILDTDAGLGTYGSDGKADAWPNYVKLSNNTCWRIVRTTGSGGVKMIYNGLYGATTAGSCANATTNAQASGGPFNYNGNDDSLDKQIVRVGYTYNSNYASNDEVDRSLSELFGTNVSDLNTTSSTVKTNIETWYVNNLSSYTSILEASAGYCGDRTIYNTSNVLQSEALEIPQYSTSTTQYNFGARVRNLTKTQSSSLTCATYNNGTIFVDRSKVDLYTVSGSIDGNGRLSKPIALLTADEASFAGTTYYGHDYLRSGTQLWLLSPNYRKSNGTTGGFSLSREGYLDYDPIGTNISVRPVISLMHHVQITSGSGTATNPYLISAP